MIRPFDYVRTLKGHEEDVMRAIRDVLHSERLILGPQTETFETEFALYTGAAHAVGVSSGTTALHMSLMALGVGHGHEVITVANTCAPTASAILQAGASPVFVDVNERDLMMDVTQIEAAITERTKAIIVVHLWGQAVDMDAVMSIARAKGLKVIEDCAQATGTIYEGRHAGTIGDAGCFSFYPTKNLGCYGDGGAIITNDPALAARLRRIRMYGYDEHGISQEPGINGRIHEIQAAILRVKLRSLSEWIRRRRTIASYYDLNIRGAGIELPHYHKGREHSFHQYVIRCANRDAVMALLREKGIGFGIHYPMPLHLMPAFKSGAPRGGLPVCEAAALQILSIPVHEALSDDEAASVALSLSGVQNA